MARPLGEQTLEVLDFLLWCAEDLVPPFMAKAWNPKDRHRPEGRSAGASWPPASLVKSEQRAGKLVMELTAHGRSQAAGGRDPVARWGWTWDGQWRMVMFDLPTSQQKVRQQLLRWLRQNGFGYLQNSVWITPDPLTELAAALAEYRDDVESLTVMEAHCHAGYSNAALVQGAWDFETINRRYDAHLSQANGELRRGLPARVTVEDLRGRLRQERVLWRNALELDPLLPAKLLPSAYRGRQAWEAHAAVMKQLVGTLGGLLDWK